MRATRRSAVLLGAGLLAILAAVHAVPPVAGNLVAPVTIEPGKVTVILGTRSLATGEIIRTTVANGLRRAIYTEDMKSDCSFVLLERWVGGAWLPLPGCALGRAPRVVAIGPGQTRSVQLNPRSFHFLSGTRPDPAKPPIGAGTYRIRFSYRLAPGPEGEEPHVAYSDMFFILP